MEDAPETPDTFLGYPCRVPAIYENQWVVSLIVDERWLVLMGDRPARSPAIFGGNAYAAVYECTLNEKGDVNAIALVSNTREQDELAAFNWVRKQLEELDGRRS